MKIIIDENIDYRITDAIKQLNVDLVSIFHKYRGSSDEEILTL